MAVWLFTLCYILIPLYNIYMLSCNQWAVENSAHFGKDVSDNSTFMILGHVRKRRPSHSVVEICLTALSIGKVFVEDVSRQTYSISWYSSPADSASCTPAYLWDHLPKVFPSYWKKRVRLYSTYPDWSYVHDVLRDKASQKPALIASA